jgi:hypothetical protein
MQAKKLKPFCMQFKKDEAKAERRPKSEIRNACPLMGAICLLLGVGEDSQKFS